MLREDNNVLARSNQAEARQTSLQRVESVGLFELFDIILATDDSNMMRANENAKNWFYVEKGAKYFI